VKAVESVRDWIARNKVARERASKSDWIRLNDSVSTDDFQYRRSNERSRDGKREDDIRRPKEENGFINTSVLLIHALDGASQTLRVLIAKSGA